MHTTESVPERRDLDRVYFRVIRQGKYVSLCFSDLKRSEQEEVIASYDADALRRLCFVLSSSLRQIGDELNIYME